MKIEEADKIMRVWGKYLEHCSGKLNMLFWRDGGKIPESLLPYPKIILDEALNMMDEHYHNIGDKHATELLRETMILLEVYGDDNEAIKHAGEMFSDPKKRKQIIASIKDWQQTWITTQQ